MFSFSDYALDNFYDEMFTAEGQVRPGYGDLGDGLNKLAGRIWSVASTL